MIHPNHGTPADDFAALASGAIKQQRCLHAASGTTLCIQLLVMHPINQQASLYNHSERLNNHLEPLCNHLEPKGSGRQATNFW